MPKKNKVSSEVIDQWPGVLDEIDIQVVPIQYMKAVEIHFLDGNTWIMDINQNLDPELSADELEQGLEELVAEYEDSISGINFVLDVQKVKKDITKRTKIFLKKKK